MLKCNFLCNAGYMDEDIIKSIAEELGLPEAFQLSVNRFPEW